jgi:hypothetical protein
MSKFPLFCIACSLLVASNALGQDIRYKFDDTEDFSKFRTYKWVTLKSQGPIDELTDEQIKAALGAALARKSLTNVEGDGAADLLIGYQTTARRDQKFDSGWTFAPVWRATGGGNNWTLYKGELAVAMSDAAKQVLVWQGSASKALDPKASPEKRQKNLDKAVAKLMKNYPPRTK